MKIGGLPGFLLAVVAWLGLTTTILLSSRYQERSISDDLLEAEIEDRREVIRKAKHDSPGRGIQGQREKLHVAKTIKKTVLQTRTVSSIKLHSVKPTESNSKAEVTLDDIFISVKTSGKFHSSRLDLILRTWWPTAKDQTYIFTDVDDKRLSNVTGGHVINTKCGDTHRRTDLCCKMGYEYDFYAESGKKWWCHFDDDNYVNVDVLLKVLQKYDWKAKMYIGKASVNHAVEAVYQGQEHVKFWFLTGGAGVCISKGLREVMDPWCRHGSLETTCNYLHLPDDCTLGFIINNRLHIDVTMRQEFNSHLQPLYLIPHTQLTSQATLSYFLDVEKQKGVANRIRLDKKQALFGLADDPTRLLSYHCLIYPDTDWCSSKRNVDRTTS